MQGEKNRRNAFGILAARWRVYHSKLAVGPLLVNDIVKATCVVNNMIQEETTPAQIVTLLNDAQEVAMDGL